MDKYELVKNDTINIGGATLYRIRALKAIPLFAIAAGTLGGYVQSVSNLAQIGNAWVFGDAQVSGNAQVFGNARVYGNAWVFGNAQVSGNAQVYGDAQVFGNAWVSGNAQVYGDAQVSGNARVFGNAQVYGNAWVFGNAWVSGDARVSGDAWVSPVCLSGLEWHVTICDSIMTIGCQTHHLKDWECFTDTQIIAMDGKNALRFWRKNKDFLLSVRKENAQ
jgi:hypothetical protein